jgi:hypothetical protein
VSVSVGDAVELVATLENGADPVELTSAIELF